VDTIGAGNARELNDLAGSLATADVVITAAGAAHFMITPELIQEARRNANGRPLVIIDIAVPRDVDPDVATLPNIRLIDIDALRDVVEDRLDRRRAAIPQVERVIADVLERFSFWYRSRSAIAPVSQLAERAELLREAEIARLFARCPDLSERERRAIIGASKRMFSQLLHAPFAKIRSLTANDLPAALRLGRTLTTLFAATPPRVRARVLGQLPLLRFEQPRVESRYVAPKIAAGRDA
jgi:glutamyl-tRNA reductase